jgi:hypothetical protein
MDGGQIGADLRIAVILLAAGMDRICEYDPIRPPNLLSTPDPSCP